MYVNIIFRIHYCLIGQWQEHAVADNRYGRPTTIIIVIIIIIIIKR